MAIQVEFYGIPRLRAGVAQANVQGSQLGDVLTALGRQYPGFATCCLDGERLNPGYLANVNGVRFVRDPATPLSAGDVLLILTADVGG